MGGNLEYQHMQETPLPIDGVPSKLNDVVLQCLEKRPKSRPANFHEIAEAMQKIAEQGGVVLYMRQEGRGIGLTNKIKAYALQDEGYDTVTANEKLGFPPDLREYGIGAQILVDLGVDKMKLLTNNPQKCVGIEGYGLEIVERIPLKIPKNKCNKKYLETKKEKLGHLLDN